MAAYPAFLLIDSLDPTSALVWQLPLAAICGPCNGVFAFHVSQLFPARARMSGFSVSDNACCAIFGGAAPPMAQLLVDDVGPHWPALYAMAAAAVGLISVIASKGIEAERAAEEGRA